MSMASNMKQISLEKVVINIGVGKSGEPLERAKNALEELTSRKPTQCSAKNNVRDFGIHKGEPIGAKVTLRNTEALEFTKRIIESKSNKLQKSSFDNYGNISIGIREHIDIPGAKYNPDIGIFGMNVCISLSRPGYRILNKSNPRKLGKKHRISKYEAIEFFENLGFEMV
ncbi:MAG: 50S ribosomal protein L5 [Thaumarchaeota archaeon]|nr:MAG: 50S ribosomal protein L5 [Nitrososphaerota archaeon]